MGANKKSGIKRHCSPAQLANLRKFGEIPHEEHIMLSKRGKAAAMAKHAQSKTFKQAAQWLLEMPAFGSENEAISAILKQYPDMNNAEAMVVAVMKNVLDNGDVKGFTALRDTTGELPAQTVNVQNMEPMTINIKTVE